MGVVISPETNEAKERAKWEMFPSVYSPNPGRPYVYRPFPKMLYKGGVDDNGKFAVTETVTVQNELEMQNMISRGFVAGPDVAVDQAKAEQRERARLAAERAHQERFMSDAARREAAAFDAATDDHVASIPETPIRRGPGRPRKDVAAPTE
jgi:hypothetical protein